MRKTVLLFALCAGIAAVLHAQPTAKSMCVSMDLAPAIQNFLPSIPVVPIEFRWVFGETFLGVALDLGVGKHTSTLVGNSTGKTYVFDSSNYRVGIGPIVKLSGKGVDGLFIKAMAIAWYYGDNINIDGTNMTPGADVNMSPGVELTLGCAFTLDRLALIAEYGAQYGPEYAGAGTFIPLGTESLMGTAIRTTFGLKIGLAF